ncbi:hypothetical protein ADK70_17365 [Streptomyces rimosus subsp. pseudoverticillatus]|nr:hypothetical protein ADK70_17365 [Streptomyces rimosus subsp. pseudoverticillatus]
MYDAKAIVNIAYRYEHREPPSNVISGDEGHSNRFLRDLGFTVIDGRPTTVDGERSWRLAVWKHFQASGNVEELSPHTVRDFGAYGGAQGIWVDSKRTSVLRQGGVTVGVLHTGEHYPDDLGEHSVLYHYPSTGRAPGRDAAEIAATKAAAELQLPVFVISKPSPSSPVRVVRLAWVEGWEDESQQFLITYGPTPPPRVLRHDDSEEEPFPAAGNRRRRRQRNVQERPDQARFKLRVFQRYGPRCPLSELAVPQMIEAAHMRPVADDGSDDPRNGLPLNAALHRAFDAHLFAIEPDTLNVVTLPDGPTAAEMGILVPHLRGLSRKPHPEAIKWRYELWRERAGLSA